MAVGIICEYNPFHNGHKYHIEKTKLLFPDEEIVLVLNGYFLQRGEISILSKEDKTKLALKFGVDLIVELPFYYGIHSADIFSYGAILILNKLKINKIVFGSESDDLEKLKKLALKENPVLIKKYLKQGLSYPKAIGKIKNIDTPNDLLGISYIKAINQINPKIIPYSIKRTSEFHDNKSNNKVISASNIRNKLLNQTNINNFVPSSILKYIKIISNEDLFPYLKYKILAEDNLNKYLLVNEGIDFKIKKEIYNSHSYSELITNLKSKRYTVTKLNRILTSILIGYEKEYFHINNLDYLKILGFSPKGQRYLKKLSIKTLINNKDSIIYKLELKSSSIYSLITKSDTLTFDLSNKPIKNH